MCSLAACHRASIGAAPMSRLGTVTQTRIAAFGPCEHRLRGSPLSATAGPAAAAAAAEQGVEGLSRADLVRTLRLRGLNTDGSEAELRQQLAAYLSDPSSLPEASSQTRPVTLLGGRLFASQAALRSHIQLLLGVLPGDEIREGHPDFAFLLALLQQHPRYADKVHAPVEAFRVQIVEEDADLHPLRFFEFLDARGKWDDFSYRKCIGISVDHNSELSFLDAMRYAITDQLYAFRMASTKTGTRGQEVHLCDCCGKRMRDGRQLRVVHANPSFRQVARDFVASTSLMPPPVDGSVPNSKRRCFTDEAWLAEWRAYHRKNVRLLQLACPKCAQARKFGEKVADAGEKTGGRQARQPAEQQWQAWTVQRQAAAGRPAAAPAGQREWRQEPRQDRQRQPWQEGQQLPRQSSACAPPQAQEGRRPQGTAEPGWQEVQQGQQGQRPLRQQRDEGQWRSPDPRMEQPAGERRQWRTADPRAELPAQDGELRRSPSPPPRERRVRQQWQSQAQQGDWLAGLAGWQQQVSGEAKQWEDWDQQSARQPPAAERARPSPATPTPGRTARAAQQQLEEEQQAQMAARAARQQAVVQRAPVQQRAEQTAAPPAVGPEPTAAGLSGEQTEWQLQQPAQQSPALAPDAFTSAETDAWLSGSP